VTSSTNFASVYKRKFEEKNWALFVTECEGILSACVWARPLNAVRPGAVNIGRQSIDRDWYWSAEECEWSQPVLKNTRPGRPHCCWRRWLCGGRTVVASGGMCERGVTAQWVAAVFIGTRFYCAVLTGEGDHQINLCVCVCVCVYVPLYNNFKACSIT
jgi:hypothetical protein